MRRREPRQRYQVYYDIILAIRECSSNWAKARPTYIQRLSNLSYDKMSRYLDELEERDMISRSPSISVTGKGLHYLKRYEELKNLTEGLGYE